MSDLGENPTLRDAILVECARCHGAGGWYVRFGPDNWDSETCPDCRGTGDIPSSAGEVSPTLRDAIADGVSAYRGSYGVGNERLYEHIEDSVRAWLAARELVVPSPQPAPEKATGHYSTLTPSQRRKKLLDEYDEVGRG